MSFRCISRLHIGYGYMYYKQREKPDLVSICARKKNYETIFRFFSQISLDLHTYIYLCEAGTMVSRESSGQNRMKCRKKWSNEKTRGNENSLLRGYVRGEI